MADLFTIAVVCTGNICRSPIGEVVIRDAIADAGLTDAVRVFSAGTGDWHLGEDADHRALSVLTENGHTLTDHRARRFAPPDFADADLILALDQSHVDALRRLTPDPAAQEKVRLLRSFDADREDDEVADPYYGDRRDFEVSYAQISAAAPGVVAHVRERLA
ncbi:low molecular weight phosphotyrosine protein phosphatase [Occultella glacieicola]|uniref:protein-tyrosine-phosphatase n=1 Tax=Occultella glacieicola TaxID=2518684 RepID=A0ABY2E8W8_9MICO|nr:low molecular weight protein-tyrosine-phosphatase [Occultella glacieicola]TDE98943.1 low molecular weight phosphotyrosine protein phosphatase [Occultella glacieicola]